MTDKIISFETAKLAHNKEFNWKTDHLDYMMDGNYVGEIGCCVSCTSYIKCPTQTQLQKWLREVHNIDVFPVACFIGEPKHKYSYYMLKANDDLDTDGCETETYEEALEHGLVEALKLIE